MLKKYKKDILNFFSKFSRLEIFKIKKKSSYVALQKFFFHLNPLKVTRWQQLPTVGPAEHMGDRGNHMGGVELTRQTGGSSAGGGGMRSRRFGGRTWGPMIRF
jgi:hypothetical protein